jgi:hypothetical protein
MFGVVSLPRGCGGLSQGLLGEFHVVCSAHLLVLSNDAQAGLEPVVVVAVVAVAAVSGSKFS